MTAARIVDPAGVLGEALSGASPDLMRHLLGTVINSCCRPKQTRCAAPSGVSRLLHTGEQLLTDRQRERIDAALAGDAHAEVEVTWAVYRQIVAPYRDPDRPPDDERYTP